MSIRDKFSKLYDVVFIVIVAIGVTLWTELMSRGLEALCLVIIQEPLVVLANIGIMSSLLAPAILFKRVKFTTALFALPIVIMSVINQIVMTVRGTPFVLSDISMISEGTELLTQYIPMGILVIVGIGVIGIVGAFILAFKKDLGQETPMYIRGYRWLGLTSISVLGVVGLCLANIVVPSTYEEYFIYEENGFIYDLTYECAKQLLPKEYLSITEQRSMEQETKHNDTGVHIRKLEGELVGLKPEVAVAELKFDLVQFLQRPFKSNGPMERKPNIIFLQLESVFDPFLLEDVTFSINPIPSIQEARAMGYSGTLEVPTFSGGTPRTEFEMLTAMNLMSISGGVPYTDGTIQDNAIETMAHVLRTKGYTTTALHNHYGDFFDRYLIYSQLGFDYFLSRETMYGLSFANGWARDDKLVEVMIETLEQTDTPDFLFGVTVSMHGPYEDISGTGEAAIEVEGIKDKGAKAQLEGYLTRLHQLDLVVKQMVDYVMTCEEDTILVIYSDHGPNLKVLGDWSKGEKHKTFYTIIDNQSELPTVTNKPMATYDIYPFIFEQLGIEDGYMNRFWQTYRESFEYEEYRVGLQDCLLEGHEAIKATDVKVGLQGPSIIRIEEEGGSLIIEGDHFTTNTFIFINDEKIGVELLAPNKVRIAYNQPLEGELYAAYVGMNNTLLRVSETYNFDTLEVVESSLNEQESIVDKVD